MRKVNIITDCTSDLTPELKEKYGIREFPLIINIGDKSYKGGVDIDTKMLFKLIDETGQMPHTASVPPAYFSCTSSVSSFGLFFSMVSRR